MGFVDVKQFVTVVGQLAWMHHESFLLRPFRRKHERDRGDVLLYMKVSVDLLLAIVVLEGDAPSPFATKIGKDEKAKARDITPCKIDEGQGYKLDYTRDFRSRRERLRKPGAREQKRRHARHDGRSVYNEVYFNQVLHSRPS